MNLQEMLGDAYKDGMTIDEIITALSTKKYADLSTGRYVDKNKYDADMQSKTNEINNYKTQLDAKLTDDEKADADSKADKARIKELEDFIKKQTISSNKDRAQVLTTDIRKILDIKDDDANYNSMLDNLSKTETDEGKTLATYINKLVKDSYEKGKKDATKDNLGAFGADLSKSSSGKDEVGSFGKKLAASSKPTIDPNLFFSNK